jgi:citrate lyase acyl carrier protein
VELKNTSIAGTMESSDIMITMAPGVGALEIELTSTVEKQFGREIRRVIIDTLSELDISSAKVTAVDKGALDCAIRARVRTAAFRAAEATAFTKGGAAK